MRAFSNFVMTCLLADIHKVTAALHEVNILAIGRANAESFKVTGFNIQSGILQRMRAGKTEYAFFAAVQRIV